MTATPAQRDQTQPPSSGRPTKWGPRLRTAAAWTLLVVTVLFGALIIDGAYGLSNEYSDPTDSDRTIALDALGGAAPFVIFMALLAALAWLLGRSRVLAVVAAASVVVTLVAVPWVAVMGAHDKADRWSAHPSSGQPMIPHCVDGFTGPIARVARAAQAAFLELDNPAGLTGGFSGATGCAAQLTLGRGIDPVVAYRTELPKHGWRITTDTPRLLSAVRRDQGFELVEDSGGTWWVWIGPKNTPPQLEGGKLSPAR